MTYWSKRAVGRLKALHPYTGQEIYVNPQKDAIISHDLDTELRRLPGTLGWYLALKTKAKSALDEARHAEHNISEDLYAEKRTEKGGSKVTETELKMLVKSDPRMRKAFRRRMDAETMVRNMEDAVEQIQSKKWTLRDMVLLMQIERNTKDHI